MSFKKEVKVEVQSVGPFQIRKAIEVCKRDIILHIRRIDEIISDLFTFEALTLEEHSKLQNLGKHNQHLEQVKELLVCVLYDESGKRSKQFLEAVCKHSTTHQLCCNLIVSTAKENLEKWLEINKLSRNVIQNHNNILEKGLRDVDGLYTKMLSNEMFCDITPIEELSFHGMSEHEKNKEIIQRVLRMDIGNICKFISIIGKSGQNKAIYDMLKGSRQYNSLQEKVEDLSLEMINETKQIMKTLSQIQPFTEKSFHLDIIQNADSLLKLNGFLFEPIGTQSEETNVEQKWENGELRSECTDIESLYSKSISKSRVVLLEGNPGTGKTIFLKKLIVDWVFDEGNHYNLMLFLPIRNVGHTSTCLTDILFEDLEVIPRKFKPVWMHLIQNEEFHKCITFCIDGVDEKVIQKQSDVMELIKGTLFPKSKVVMTTRMYHNVIQKFKPYADAVIVLNGVSTESRDVFIKHVLGSQISDDEVSGFITKCTNYLFQDDILSVPVYLTLLCLLAKDHCEKEKTPKLQDMALPKTRFELYNTFQRIFENRYFKYLMKKIPDIEGHIQHNIDTISYLIGRMSYHGLCKEQYLFTSGELKENCLETEVIQHIGYFVQDLSSTRFKSKSYWFYHKTFQEYFAGLYCAKEGFLKCMPHVLISTGEFFQSPSMVQGFRNITTQVVSKERCLEYERRELKPMQETFSPLQIALQFAAGSSEDFTKELLLFATSGCSLAKSQDVFDTSYECSLLYECQSVKLFGYFTDFLTLSQKVLLEHVTTVLPNSYNNAVYQFISQNISNTEKREIFGHLYGLKANIYSSEKHEGVLSIGYGTIAESDMLLSSLVCKKLPPVITVKGNEVNLDILTPVIDQNRYMTSIKLVNADFSKFESRIWNSFVIAVEGLDRLICLKLPFCNLQKHHFEAIFVFVEKSQSLKQLDISGNNLENITGNAQRIFRQLVQQTCTELFVSQNCIHTYSWKADPECVSLKLDHVYIHQISVLLAFKEIKSLCIHNTVLKERSDKELWKGMFNHLKKCVKLSSLELSGCEIDDGMTLLCLSEVLGHLPLLKVLNLSNNNFSKIEDLAWDQFNTHLSRCGQLLHLDISRCRIETTKKVLALGNLLNSLSELEEINIADNNFSNIHNDDWRYFVEGLAKLTKLKHLDIANCHITTGENLKCLATAVHKMEHLENMDCSDICFNATSDDWSYFMSGIKRCGSLQHLTLSHESLSTTISAMNISELFSENSNLQSLDLSRNIFTKTSEPEWRTLCTKFQLCVQLKELNISHCSLSQPYHVTHLTTAIRHLLQLEKIILSGNDLSEVKKEQWCDFSNALSTTLSSLILCKCFVRTTYLQNPMSELNIGRYKNLIYLELPHNKLGNLSMQEWAKFMKIMEKCQCLEYLKLSKNKLKSGHLFQLGQTLEKLHHLEHLNLDDNNFNGKEHEWEQFLNHLEKCKKLKKLKISKCGLSSNFHFKYVGSLLHHLPKLEHLDISENNLSRMEEDTMKQFTSGLKHCRALDKLNLHRCSLHSDYQITLIGRIFPSLTHLRRLNLNDNSFHHIEENDWKEFCMNLQICKKLQKLQLSRIGLDKEYYWKIMTDLVVKLPRLFYLSLSGNDMSKISSSEMCRFREALKQCSQLHTLYVPSNSPRKRKYIQESEPSWHQGTGKSFNEFLSEAFSGDQKKKKYK